MSSVSIMTTKIVNAMELIQFYQYEPTEKTSPIVRPLKTAFVATAAYQEPINFRQPLSPTAKRPNIFTRTNDVPTEPRTCLFIT